MINYLLTYLVTNVCRSLFLLIDDFLYFAGTYFCDCKRLVFPVLLDINFCGFWELLVKLHVEIYNLARWREFWGTNFFREFFSFWIVEKKSEKLEPARLSATPLGRF